MSPDEASREVYGGPAALPRSPAMGHRPSDNRRMTASFLDKLCTADQLAERLSALARPVVFTNGVFDILHRGHVSYLAQARALGASLVVGLNSDASARGLGKGPDRPLNNELDRACAK